jgi:hypothetical protein
MSLTM